jgi:hypothetical protein
MMKETFEQLVWSLVEEKRDETLVVDNHHAYGIIRDRVDSLWEQIRLLQPDDDQLMVLGGFVALAAYTQLAAEKLMLVPEQLRSDDRHKVAEKNAEDARKQLRELLIRIDREKRPIQALQKGVKRYALEFNEDTLESWRRLIEDLA